MFALDQLGDELDDLRNRFGRLGHVIRETETEIVDVLEVPLRRVGGELGARAARGRLVDLVVDVRDVVDECHVVSTRA